MQLERHLAWPCRDCGVRGSSFCGTLIDRAESLPPAPANYVSQIFWQADRDSVIRSGGANYLSGPFVLCKGWAYRFYRFPDGRRQILSVLIPGDPFSVVTLLDPNSNFAVQAATDVKFCQLAHDDLKGALATQPHVRDSLGALHAAEMDDAISTAIELNESDAAKRVAGFLRRLIRRMSARRMAVDADVYPFPLSEMDIADATGLDPGDVNRALQKLRQSAILSIANDRITIIDAAELDGFVGSRSSR